MEANTCYYRDPLRESGKIINLFRAKLHYYIPEKRKKTRGFQTILGSIEINIGLKWIKGTFTKINNKNDQKTILNTNIKHTWFSIVTKPVYEGDWNTLNRVKILQPDLKMVRFNKANIPNLICRSRLNALTYLEFY